MMGWSLLNWSWIMSFFPKLTRVRYFDCGNKKREPMVKKTSASCGRWAEFWKRQPFEVLGLVEERQVQNPETDVKQNKHERNRHSLKNWSSPALGLVKLRSQPDCKKDDIYLKIARLLCQKAIANHENGKYGKLIYKNWPNHMLDVSSVPVW